MLTRRDLMRAGTALGVGVTLPLKGFADVPKDPSVQLNALFDSFVAEGFDLSPETVSSLGLDVGARAYQKALLGDRSPDGANRANRLNESQLLRLQALDVRTLTPKDRLNAEIVLYNLIGQVESAKRFKYAGGAAGAPYVFNQLQGAYHDIPDFLDTEHSIENKEDADAYLSRLVQIPAAIDGECAQARLDESLGVIAPDFVLDKTLAQLQALRDTPSEQSVLVQSLTRRTKDKAISGDWAKWASHILDTAVKPALDREISLIKEQRGKASHEAGVWHLPDGEAYYRASIRQWTTTDKTGDEIHQIGLARVAELSAKADELMKAAGLTKGTVGERYRAMYEDSKFHYPNTDQGKEKLIKDLNLRVKQVKAKLPDYFGILPKTDVEIRRVPAYTEAGSPGGYYMSPSLDGKRPGAYYINLRDTSEQPSWALPTLTYHESIPGHHLQGSIALESNAPLIRKLLFFSAYLEGWALYAEQLADEMGLYDQDPMGRLGYIHDALFRAVRLVVDSGLHAKRWSREAAVKYFVDNIGDKDSAAITEVERYCVWPGQACGYMLGKLEILRLRTEAKAKMGSRFNLKTFHDAILLPGAMPLDVLSKVVANYEG